MSRRSDEEEDALEFTRVYLSSFGERVRKLREKREITLKELARLSGLSDRYIIEVEKGAANPSLTSVAKLARSLQTSVTDLLSQGNQEVPAASRGLERNILSLLENRPQEQLLRVRDAVAAFLESAGGNHIALIGMRGAGKTTIGNLIARRMHAPFYELDELIEKNAGLSLAEIFDLEGEQYYRAVEEKTLQRTLKRAPGVIASGGGLVTSPPSLFLLKLHAFIVWLQASPEALMARVRSGKDSLRLRASPQMIKQLKTILDRRTPFYAQADLVVDTTRKPPEVIADAVVKAFRGTRKPKAAL